MRQEMADLTSVRESIDRTNRRFEAAIEEGDAARVALEVYTRDGRVLPPGAPTVQGRESIGAFWEGAAMQLGLRRVQLHTQELEVTGDTAWEIGRATLFLAGDQQASARYVVLWKREDGEWRWHIDIWNDQG